MIFRAVVSEFAFWTEVLYKYEYSVGIRYKFYCGYVLGRGFG